MTFTVYTLDQAVVVVLDSISLTMWPAASTCEATPD